MSDSEGEDSWLAQYPEQQCLEALKKIGREWKQDNNPFGHSWNQLKQAGRLFLLEVACSPNSVLSQEVDKRFGQDAAMRCSLYNGYV